MSDRKITYKFVDMSEEMAEEAIKFAVEALDMKDATEKDISKHIKTIFDKK